MAFQTLYYLAACISVTLCQQNIYEILIKPAEVYDLPALPYPYDGLEPFLDELTLRVHHLGHHKSYANKMNAALKDWRLKASIKTSSTLYFLWVWERAFPRGWPENEAKS